MKILNMKNRIMFGVYLLYFVRKLKKPFVLESSAFIVLALVLFSFVSVPHVLSNMFQSGDLSRYFISAFSNTTLMVQMILVLGLATATKAVLTLSQSSSVGRAPLS